MAEQELKAKISADASGLNSAVEQAKSKINGLKTTLQQGAEKINVAGVELGKLTDAFSQSATAGASAGAVITAGVKAIGDIIKGTITLMQEADATQRELADIGVKSLKEVHDENEKRRQDTRKYLDEIKTLQSAEKLSETQKVRQIELLEKLTRSYGNLGFQIDGATGKIRNFDEASLAAQKKMLQDRLKELEAERGTQLGKMNTANETIANLRGYNELNQGYIAGLKKDSEEAAAAAIKLAKEIREVSLELKNFDKTAARRKQASEKERRENALKNATNWLNADRSETPEQEYNRKMLEISDAFAKMVKDTGAQEGTVLYGQLVRKRAELEKQALQERDEALKKQKEQAEAEVKARQDAEEALADFEEQKLVAEKTALEKLISEQEKNANAWKTATDKLKAAQQTIEDIRRDLANKKDAAELNSLNTKLASFGFSIDKKNPNAKIDAQIAEKLQRRADGEKVKFTGRQKRRLNDYKKTVKKRDAKAKEIEQKQKAQEAEDIKRRLDAAQKQMQAAQQELQAAQTLKTAADRLLAAAGGKPAVQGRIKAIDAGVAGRKKQKEEQKGAKLRADVVAKGGKLSAPGVPATATARLSGGQTEQLLRDIDNKLGKKVYVVK